MNQSKWVRFAGASVLAGLTTLTAGCWNGSGIKNGSNPGPANLAAAKVLLTSLAAVSPGHFADFSSGFSNEVDAASLLAPKSLMTSLGIALSDAGSFFESQGGTNGTASFGALTVTIAHPSGIPVVTVSGSVGFETVNLIIDSPQAAGAGTFSGTFDPSSTIATSAGPGENLAFKSGSVAIATSNSQPIASGGSNVAAIAIQADIALAQLSGATPVSFMTTSKLTDLGLALCKNGTFCLGQFDILGTFSQGSDQLTAELLGQLSNPTAFDPTAAPGVGNVPAGAFQFLIFSETIASVPPTTVAIAEELSAFYSDGVTQTPIGGFRVRVDQNGGELLQVQINTTPPMSGTGPVVFTADVSNSSPTVLMINNPFTGETAGQVGQASNNGTVVGTLTAAGGGALTLTFADATPPQSLFDVTAVESTVASLFD